MLVLVRPETVVAWHRRGFAWFWTWRSRRVGRPPLPAELVLLIEQMARENPLWSRRRIANELAKLGHAVGTIGADFVPVRLIRDRDGIFGAAFEARVNHFGIRQLKIAPRSPWQNCYAERFVGTLRRELLDHLIVVGERHLLRAVREYVAYYNNDRLHMSLAGDAPFTRPIEPPERGKIVALPKVGGLHHRYSRAA